MLFNSTIFLQFFGAFLLLHFLCRGSVRGRNLLILGLVVVLLAGVTWFVWSHWRNRLGAQE